MSEEKKKRPSYYDPEAQKRWVEKNKEKKRYIDRRSTARGFIRKDATLEDLQELRNLIDERERALSESDSCQ